MEQYILVALRTLKDFITSQKALEEIGNELIRIFQLVADVEEETSAALSLLSSLLERFPSAWRECIKPIIYNQTKRAYLCLWVISKIDKKER